MRQVHDYSDRRIPKADSESMLQLEAKRSAALAGGASKKGRAK